MTVHWCTCTYTCAGTMLVLAREIVLVFALVLVFVPVPELVYLQDCVCTRLFSNVRTCACTCMYLYVLVVVPVRVRVPEVGLTFVLVRIMYTCFLY